MEASQFEAVTAFPVEPSTVVYYGHADASSPACQVWSCPLSPCMHCGLAPCGCLALAQQHASTWFQQSSPQHAWEWEGCGQNQTQQIFQQLEQNWPPTVCNSMDIYFGPPMHSGHGWSKGSSELPAGFTLRSGTEPPQPKVQPAPKKAVKGLGNPQDIGVNKERCDRLVANLQPSPDTSRKTRAQQVMAWILQPTHTRALSFRKFGCRLIQEALDKGSGEQRLQLSENLQPCVLELLDDPHGNHVLAKLIEVLPPQSVSYISLALKGQTLVFAKRRFGCRILERLIEHCGEDQLNFLLDEVQEDVEALARHQYGNFVVQHLLEHGSHSRKHRAIESLRPFVCEHAKHRTASHVVQRMLEHSDQAIQQLIIDQFLRAEGGAAFEALMPMRYGSFVVKQVLDLALTADALPWVQEVLMRVRVAHQLMVENPPFGIRNIVEPLGEAWFRQ